MRTKNKNVYGVGINDILAPIRVSGKMIPLYQYWGGMLRRCYYIPSLRDCPTYTGCSVHQSWRRLSAFKLWFDRNYVPGYDLDKDILIPGNKVYGPWTCCFVPHHVNTLLLDCRAACGRLPRGVWKHSQRGYSAGCRTPQGKKYAWFKTILEAEQWYKETKTSVIHEVADSALAAGEISRRIHAGLLRHARNLM